MANNLILQTMTDAKGFRPHVIDTKRFTALNATAEKLSQELEVPINVADVQKIWESARNSCLEILPTKELGLPVYDDICLNYAEKFAFTFVEQYLNTLISLLQPAIKKLINDNLQVFMETTITPFIKKTIAESAPAAGAPGGSALSAVAAAGTTNTETV